MTHEEADDLQPVASCPRPRLHLWPTPGSRPQVAPTAALTYHPEDSSRLAGGRHQVLGENLVFGRVHPPQLCERRVHHLKLGALREQVRHHQELGAQDVQTASKQQHPKCTCWVLKGVLARYASGPHRNLQQRREQTRRRTGHRVASEECLCLQCLARVDAWICHSCGATEKPSNCFSAKHQTPFRSPLPHSTGVQALQSPG